MMKEDIAETVGSELMPADKAALRSLRLAFLSIAIAGMAVWLSNFFGLTACTIGLFLWWFCWLGAVGLAVSALRGAYASNTPEIVRRRAKVSLAVSGVNMVVALAFIWGITQVQQIQ